MIVTQDCPETVITLHPGDVAVAQRGQTLETLLGSCVAIALTDPRRTLGVLCHIVHPGPPTMAQTTNTAYITAALCRMDDLLQRHGLAASMCDAFVYGGGNMFPALVSGSGVGGRNSTMALNALADIGARIRHVDVGGTARRQLRWQIGAPAPMVQAVPS